MKKVLSFVLVFALLFSLAAADKPIKKGTKTNDSFIGNLPNLHQADEELAENAKEDVREATAKMFKGLAGKAYMKPKSADRVTHLDKTGSAKGIAILVDFPIYDEEGNEMKDDENGRISDVPGVDYERIPKEKFDDLLNGEEYDPYDLEMFTSLRFYDEEEGNTGDPIEAPTDRTLRNYYDEVSYGQFSIDVDVVGWYTLPESYNYYMGQDDNYYNGNENGFTNIALLVKDAIKCADDDGVDFSEYAVDAQPGDFADLYGDDTSFVDEDGNIVDKIVPNIFIIHRGTGAEYNLDPEIIWSHKWDILSADYWGYYDRTGQEMDEEDLKYHVVDGVVLNVYNACPEVGQDINGYLKISRPDIVGPDYEGRDPSPPYPGVYCHEFGHVLGLPDQYDYGYDSEGTGRFTLMAAGDSGGHIDYRWYRDNTPVHMDGWSKYHLGFAEPIEINPEDGRQTITLRPVAEEPDYYKIVVPGSDGREYFMLENRQQIGYDEGFASFPGSGDMHGLLIYHIVEDIYARNPHRPNEAANWDNDHLGKSQQGVDDYIYETGETHYAFSVIQADAGYELELGYSMGDDGDLFPGKYNVTKLESKTNNKINTSSVYKWAKGNTETGIVIENIVEDEEGTITCDVYFKNK